MARWAEKTGNTQVNPLALNNPYYHSTTSVRALADVEIVVEVI